MFKDVVSAFSPVLSSVGCLWKMISYLTRPRFCFDLYQCATGMTRLMDYFDVPARLIFKSRRKITPDVILIYFWEICGPIPQFMLLVP